MLHVRVDDIQGTSRHLKSRMKELLREQAEIGCIVRKNSNV